MDGPHREERAASDELDRDVSRAIYRRWLDDGHAPAPPAIARDLAVAPVAVEDALRRMAGRRELVLAPGTPYVWMANPLSALPTPFAVEARGLRLWGNCIWDALGISAMLREPATVTCSCADCAEPLSFDAAPGRPPEPEWVVHFAVPAAQWWDDIGFN